MGAAELLRQVQLNFGTVTGRIADAAGDRPIRLICVTKYATLPWIEALLAAGATELAENLLPDAVERFDTLRWSGHSFTPHLIGAQQSRKLKLIPGNFDWFQAVDSEKTADKLQEHLAGSGEPLQVLLQVNIAEEPQKHGFSPAETVELFGAIQQRCPQLELRGLMAIPPWPDAYADDAAFEQGTRRCFRQTKALFDRICDYYRDRGTIDTLSLGMSLDYVWAIEEGATMVRVGSALFEGLEG